VITFNNIDPLEGAVKNTDFSSPEHGAVTCLTLDELKTATATGR
jgi:hypothetical protein